ncbi:hypothetical protein C8J57DRAFT_1242909 [Mycena rebaudengoi]|nr:hypothetical protein C8J57DRAFT_1242909 [Mycena rebaudengoi]
MTMSARQTTDDRLSSGPRVEGHYTVTGPDGAQTASAQSRQVLHPGLGRVSMRQCKNYIASYTWSQCMPRIILNLDKSVGYFAIQDTCVKSYERITKRTSCSSLWLKLVSANPNPLK